MNRYAYRIQYDAAAHEGGAALTPDEVFAALSRFLEALPAALMSLRARVAVCEPLNPQRPALRLAIRTSADWAQAASAVAALAARHGLRASYLPRALIGALVGGRPFGAAAAGYSPR